MASPATQGDQAAYLAYAKQIYDGHYTFAGDRNRMPVFPFLLSLLYRPGMSEKEFLTRAQVFNVNLSIVLLLLLWLILRKSFPTLHALALLIITAFGVFLYRAVMVQAEVLFYFDKLLRISPSPANADRAPLVARALERSNDGHRAFDQGIDFARARSAGLRFFLCRFSE